MSEGEHSIITSPMRIGAERRPFDLDSDPTLVVFSLAAGAQVAPGSLFSPVFLDKQLPFWCLVRGSRSPVSAKHPSLRDGPNAKFQIHPMENESRKENRVGSLVLSYFMLVFPCSCPVTRMFPFFLPVISWYCGIPTGFCGAFVALLRRPFTSRCFR